MKQLIILFIINTISLVLTTSSPDVTDPRKTVRQPTNIGSAHLNSLTSSQDGVNKQQPQPQQAQQTSPQVQQPSQQPIFNRPQYQQDHTHGNQPQSSVYSHIQSGAHPASPQGYIFSVNPQGGQHGLPTVGPTPVLMQYLPQQHQPTAGGIQYLQLIPTRPLIVPISPYITNLPQQYGNAAANPTQATGQQQYQAAYTQVQPANYATYGPSVQNPVGGYSAPVVSYFRPHSGIQLVEGPVDMSLNTNEYIPIQGESSYKLRRA